MKKSLQQIEDFYTQQGYEGERLRTKLEKDEEWKKIVKERHEKLTKRFSLTQHEKRAYVMSTDKDVEILARIKKLEMMSLTREDRRFLMFMRTQLQHDWRRPFIHTLNKMLRKYSKKKGVLL